MEQARWRKIALAGVIAIAGLLAITYPVAPGRPSKLSAPAEISPGRRLKETVVKMATPDRPVELDGDDAPSGNKGFIKTPPQTRLISSASKDKGPLRESVLKLESLLSPTELQVYYTDLLLSDWMIARDDLTDGVGWSGVFMQLEPTEKTMGVFAVVKRIGPPSGPANPTSISILKTEEH